MAYSNNAPGGSYASGHNGSHSYDNTALTPRVRHDPRDMPRERTPDEVREVRRLLYILERQRDRQRDEHIDDLQYCSGPTLIPVDSGIGS